jgi:cell wall-associated NlpC family hydrolase
VGIYVGDGKFIHAPRPGKDVRIDDMREAYWQKRFNGARRVETDKILVEPLKN